MYRVIVFNRLHPRFTHVPIHEGCMHNPERKDDYMIMLSVFVVYPIPGFILGYDNLLPDIYILFGI